MLTPYICHYSISKEPQWSSDNELPPTFGVGGSNPGPYAGKLVVAYQWLAVHRTLTNCMHWFPPP